MTLETGDRVLQDCEEKPFFRLAVTFSAETFNILMSKKRVLVK